MNMIYTVTVHLASKVRVMGGKLMTVTVTGDRTFNFTSVEEANRFDDMMKLNGYETEMGIRKATAEEAAEQVAIAHQKLGSSLGPQVGSADDPVKEEA